MVEKRGHLTTEQKKESISLFHEYKELFSGKLGSVPEPPVKLELKQDATPFHSRAYMVPQDSIEIAKTEVKELVTNDVLEENVRTAY